MSVRDILADKGKVRDTRKIVLDVLNILMKYKRITKILLKNRIE